MENNLHSSIGKISIILPVYNAEKYIHNTINCILSQTYSNWELIAINDGSVDSTYEILKSFAQNEHRIILINKENGGASQARNIGLSNATGEYIAFIDDDDYVDPDFLNKLVDVITEFNADIAMCNIIQNDGALEYNWEQIEFFKGKDQIFDEYAREGICNRIWNKLYRREVVEGIYFANDRPIGEDSLWTPQVMERASSLVRIPNGYYKYIIRQNSLMHGGRPDNMARLEFLTNAFLGMLIILKFANDQEGRAKKLKVSISLCIQAVTRNLDLHYFETDRIIQSFIKQNPDIYDYCSTNAEKLVISAIEDGKRFSEIVINYRKFVIFKGTFSEKKELFIRSLKEKLKKLIK